MINQIPKIAYLETTDQLVLISEDEDYCIKFHDNKFSTQTKIKP